MTYDVFISYSRKDTATADQICEALDKAGITYFIDRQGIAGGMEFITVIAKAIRESKVFLFLASENSYVSNFTIKEINYAFNKGKTMYPYIIDDSKLPEDLELAFSDINWRMMREHPIESVLVLDLLLLMGREARQTEEKQFADEQRLEEERRRAEEEKRREKEKRRAEEEARKWAEEEAKKREEERKRAEEELRLATSDLEFTVNGVTFKMIYVESGTFQMGATPEQGSEAADNEKPVHPVKLSNYHIGETPVTQALWKAVMGSNPSGFKGDNLPVDFVSWNDCQEFIQKLNRLTDKTFRLPTEAEWEYAARGGKCHSPYKYAGSDSIDEVAWYWKNSGDKYLAGTDNDRRDNVKTMLDNHCKAHPVKTKKPNALGIYDMSGNVWECCQDRYGAYSGSKQTDPKGPSEGLLRVLRGGSWFFYARDCRVSSRFISTPDSRDIACSFRLALVHQ